MKIRLILILFVVFIYVSYAQSYAQIFECNNFFGSNRTECYYQFLLKRWQKGADGQEQGAIDSTTLRRVLNALSRPSSIESPKRHREIVNLWLYRGLGIFIFNYATFISECVGLHYDGVPIKMVQGYYNIDVDSTTIKRNWWWDRHRRGNYSLMGVRGLPNDEAIVFLISDPTGEILSTYRYKEKRRSENGFADILE